MHVFKFQLQIQLTILTKNGKNTFRYTTTIHVRCYGADIINDDDPKLQFKKNQGIAEMITITALR
jgi:hypothetical protein